MTEILLGKGVKMKQTNKQNELTCLSLSNVSILSTADTPFIYFSMYVSPSAALTSFCDAAIWARLSICSKSSDAWIVETISKP
jgi:hypothetical protein